MRIIDKRRDYYDSVQSLGQDQSLVYVRKEKVVWEWDGPRYYDCFSYTDVGFCGELYRGAHLHLYESPAQTTDRWCYSIEACDEAMESASPKARDYYHGVERAKRPFGMGGHDRRASVLAFLNKERRPEDRARMLGAFHEHNAPVIAWETHRTVVNPLLRDYGFVRVKDPYTAFQEIAQYLGGVLRAPVKPVPEVPDEVMQQIKGFDHQYSFRKEPGKKQRGK